MRPATWRTASALLAQAAVTLTTSLALAAPATATAVEDIRDIRAPLAIPPWWRWPLAIGLAALAAFAVVAALGYWRRRHARRATPLERARQALLVAEAHARAGRARVWADIVAETLRAALAVRLGAAVLPQTTSELADASRTDPRLARDLDLPLAVTLLETCDLARFARGTLVPDALLAATGLVRELVERLFTLPIQPEGSPPRAEVVTS